MLRKCEAKLSPRLLFLVSEGQYRLTYVAPRFPARDPAKWGQAECVAFVRLSQDAVDEWISSDGDTGNYTQLSRLLDRMAACAQRCLILELRNCGVPDSEEFRWPRRLRQLFDPKFRLLYSSSIPLEVFPHRLVNTLAELSNGGLISNEARSDHIQALVQCSLVASGGVLADAPLCVTFALHRDVYLLSIH